MAVGEHKESTHLSSSATSECSECHTGGMHGLGGKDVLFDLCYVHLTLRDCDTMSSPSLSAKYPRMPSISQPGIFLALI